MLPDHDHLDDHDHDLDDDDDHDDGGAAINHYCVHVDHEHGRVDVYDHAGHGPHYLLAGDDRAAALDDLAAAIATARAATGVVRPALH